jgi:hypothetical protein
VLPGATPAGGRRSGWRCWSQLTFAHLVADRMAAPGIGALPVVSRSGAGSLVGMLTQSSLLQNRERLLVEERRAEKLLTLRRTGRPLVAARGDSCNN